jgi:hypothetical protein
MEQTNAAMAATVRTVGLVRIIALSCQVLL